MSIRPSDLPPECLAAVLKCSRAATFVPPPGGNVATPGDLAAGAVAGWCVARGWPVPVREWRFAPPRRWRFDLAWVAERVAVEFQGGVWTGGRHTRPRGYARDLEKFSTAASLGWRVLPVTYGQVRDGKLFGWLGAIFGAGV